MKIKSFRMVRIRCFEDTNTIELSPTCNIFIGQNNAGKSTLLKGLLAFQGFPFSFSDIRPGSHSSYHQVVLTNVMPSELVRNRPNANAVEFRMVNVVHGAHPPSDNFPSSILNNNVAVFDAARPNHTIIPFLAKRKAPEFTHDITAGSQSKVLGTYSNLYSRVDLLATAGHPRHDQFQKAISEIVGLPITTKASANGKEAGFYLDDDTFVSLDRMGDGVTDMVALIVELCLERDKVFILEEPETNLHPNGLKALLSMVRASTAQNQFVISTHSNIVVRELGSDEGTKLFRVWRDDEDHKAPSSLEEVPRTPSAHIAVLRELGYGFGDFGLHEGWLFLEESSAESIVNQILIPNFAPSLKGKLRSFSAGGTSKLASSIAEFQRLITFIHLQPAYAERIWIRADGDESGRDAIKAIRDKFKYFDDQTCGCFTKASFEYFYPSHFEKRVAEVLAIKDKAIRRTEKARLLQDVIQWTADGGSETVKAWDRSAGEPITLLRSIGSTIG